MSKRAMFQIVCLAIFLALQLVTAIRSAPQSATSNVSLTGTVSCSVCLAKHSVPKLKIYTRLSCTDCCIINLGASFVLVVGNETYKLEGDRNQIKKFAGGEATVSGTVQGGTFKVSTIDAPHKNLKSEIYPRSVPNNGFANSALITANFSPHHPGRFFSPET